MHSVNNKVSSDDAAMLLTLAARLYGVSEDPGAWITVLRVCRDLLGNAEVFDLSPDQRLARPDDLAALAGRVTHSACYGGAASESDHDALRRSRAAALAAHLHQAAIARRHMLQAALFDFLPATWILDREAYVLTANAAAKRLLAAGGSLSLVDGRLLPDAPAAGEKLRRTLKDLVTEVRFSWPSGDGSEAAILLRPLPGQRNVSATLLDGPPTILEMAKQLTQDLSLTTRQGELAAYLLAGHDLSDAARRMAISRNTANEHLTALLRRTGAPDRKTLLGLLRKTVRC